MKRILAVIAIAVTVFAVRAWCSSVTTTDGKLFNVTNDVGYTAVMSNADIMAQLANYNQQYTTDSQRVLTEQESVYVWSGVEQMAVNTAAPYQVNAVVNSVNAVTNSVNSTGD